MVGSAADDQPQEQPNLRRSERQKNKSKLNYKELHEGVQKLLNPGNTAISQYLAEDHNHGELEVLVLGRETNWYRRGVKEEIRNFE